MEIIKIEDISFYYPGEETAAIWKVSLDIHRGEFVVLCGESGCGKTTLLRMLKEEIRPEGKLQGNIRYLKNCDQKIGFVMQCPEEQIVTDKVWHELAFGLENMGKPTDVIRRRVAEISGFFGIQSWFYKKTAELSGGQKQLLNLAAVMVMEPEILILDEPTAQLDPIAAADFIHTLQRLNQELGLTILLAEHHMEEAYPAADRIWIMEQGSVVYNDSPRNTGAWFRNQKEIHPMLWGMPSAVRIYQGLNAGGECPVTVKECRAYLQENYKNEVPMCRTKEHDTSDETALKIEKLWFRYERDLPDVLKELSLVIKKGEIVSILGGNGSGKTTLLNVIAGQYRPYAGKIYLFGKKLGAYRGNSLYRNLLALLPQNPQTLFLRNSVEEDYLEFCRMIGYERTEAQQKAEELLERFELKHLRKRHPYDLSGGEQQKAALGKLLLSNPKVLLLDEPTKGIDACAKHHLAELLKELKKQGITILMVTHDIEFAAEVSDRCGMLFQGQMISMETPERFFQGNSFYTTAANRIAGGLYGNVVTCDDVIRVCMENGRK